MSEQRFRELLTSMGIETNRASKLLEEAREPEQSNPVVEDRVRTFRDLLEEAQQCPSGLDIVDQCIGTAALLLEKNLAYGDSVLNPVMIMSKLSPVERICDRIDDKLSRLARGNEAGEDVYGDLCGYYELLGVARKRAKEGRPSPRPSGGFDFPFVINKIEVHSEDSVEARGRDIDVPLRQYVEPEPAKPATPLWKPIATAYDSDAFMKP